MKKIIRINPKAIDQPKIFGLTPSAILDSVRESYENHWAPRFGHSQNPKSIRLYRVFGEKPFFVAKVVGSRGDQTIFRVRYRKGKVTFTQMGEFAADFDHREIYDHSMRGKGLGRMAFRTFLASNQKKGVFQSEEKSTLVLLLKQGCKLIFPKSAKALRKLQVRDEQTLLTLVSRKQTPEDLRSILGRERIWLYYKKK